MTVANYMQERTPPYTIETNFSMPKLTKVLYLSALDVKKVPTVQHFVPKSADSTALFSGFGVIS